MVKSLGRISTLMAAAVIAVAVGGCSLKHPTANLVTGKKLFATNCASCHTLSHANSTGTVGPNLDDAFRQDRIDGVKSTSIQGLIDYWIQYPNTQGVMPAMLVKGQDAQDVAAYVAAVAAKPGQDTGALAAAVAAKVNPTPRGREADLHRRRRLRLVPHARGGRDDRHGRTQSQHAEGSLRDAGVPAGARLDVREVHRDRDHRSVQVHPGGLQVRHHAEHLQQDAQSESDPGSGGVLVGAH